MNKYIFLLSLCCFVLSCDDFLDRKPLDQLTTDNFYVTESDGHSAALSAYSVLQDIEWYGKGWMMLEIPSDNTQPGGTDPEFSGIDNFTVNGDTPPVGAFWGTRYRLITFANVFLEKIPDMEVSEKLKDQFAAECRFLRALGYFDLVRIFGDVPLITIAPAYGDDLLYPRTSANEVYELIKEDLIFAAENLPVTWSGTDVGRATTGAANGLLAKVHLTRREIGEARDRAKLVIDSEVYELMDNYEDNFELEHSDNNSESVFQIQYTGCNSFGTGNAMQAFFAPWGEGITKDRDGWGSQIPTGPSTNNPGTTILDAFESGDLRKDPTEGSITKLLTEEYVVYEYDFTGVYNDLGYGGTPCTDLTAPCPVDPTRIANIAIFIEPGGTEFIGSVSMDFISFGVSLDPPAPPGVLAYGDHCNNNATDNLVDPFGLVSEESDSEWTITGDGTATPYSAVAYNTFDQQTGQNVVVDATGNNKLFIRASSTVGSVPLRIDLVDTSGYVTSLASLTKSLSTDMETYEYDFSANYQDGGFGGTACMTGPCPVDGSAISTILLYPNPVDGEYNGVITIDYLSFGAPMGADVGPIGIANYSDDYLNDDLSFISDNAGLVSSILNSEWTITGDGSSGAFGSIVYDIHDQVDGTSIIATAQGSNDKLYIRAKSTVDGTQLRVDLQDLEGYVTSSPSVQNGLTTEYTVLEFDYINTYTDGGFGGTPCSAGPCDVDGERVNTLQFFIDPGTGMFNGEVTIDWISFGQPFNLAPTGVIGYADDYLNNDLSFIEDEAGLTSAITDGVWNITGDGTSGAFAPASYSAHDLTNGDSIAIDAIGSNDKLYIRAKSSAEGTMLRIDLQDAQGYVTSNPSVERAVGQEYEVIEYDYSNTYTDGGFGGTPCTAGPCPVDGQRISDLQFFIDPGTGAFNGVLSIDWISFGNPIGVAVDEISELDAFKIFPNPTAGEIAIELDLNQQGDVQVNVYDAVGRLVHAEDNGSLSAGNQFQKIDLSNLNNGLYFVQVIINNKNTKAVAITKQ